MFAGERVPVRAAQTGNRITLNPDTFSEELEQLHELLQSLPRDLLTYHL